MWKTKYIFWPTRCVPESPNRQARVDVKNLPPDVCLVAAVDWVEDGGEERPVLLELLLAFAVRVLLGERAHRTITLPLTMPGQ